jgi:hypothetical protein
MSRYTGAMRAGRWFALVSLALALPAPACSGGYPLPPTRCDEFCDATKGGFCPDWYSPASCVANCESSETDAERCRVLFDATVSCFRTSPRALQQRCVYDNSPDDCEDELRLLLTCVSDRSGISSG